MKSYLGKGGSGDPRCQGGRGGGGVGGGGGGGAGGGGGGGAGGGGGGGAGAGGGGGIGGGGGVFGYPWAALQPVLEPHPDLYTAWDRHRPQVNLIQAVMGGMALTHREIRRIRDPNLGAIHYPVAVQGLPPYPLNPRVHVYDNRLLLPSLIPRAKFKTLFGFSANDFYHIRSAREGNLLLL